MIGKNGRLTSIRKLIETHDISNQEMLARLLKNEGFSVTQATLSRDLKQLQAGKVPDGRGGYLYAFPDTNYKALSGRGLSEQGLSEQDLSEQDLIEDFRRGFLVIQFSANFGIVKTLPGHASTVAFALDKLRIAGVLGTVAGDDTILVIPHDGVSRDQILYSLEERIPGFQE